MKKVLIYLNESDLAPTGGANGYKFTLRQGLDATGTDDFKNHY